MPFFVSGGADSMIKIYEHNPYMPVLEGDDKNDDKPEGEMAKPPAQAQAPAMAKPPI